MIRFSLLLITFILSQPSEAQYFPGNWGDWETRNPAEMGFNSDSITAVIEYAIANETTNPRSMEENHYGTFGREPFGDGVGAFKDRGDQTGIIIKDGYIIAEWGEPFRVDMTHSVTKTFLSSTVGIAYDMGLIRDVHDNPR